jgi:murein DD-endopeptidase MepM/ murein hydrolase activator NlpD
MITLAALITPMLIASEPMAITIDEIQTKYSHAQQTIVSLNGTPIYATYSGTQTFTGNGVPHDADND